MVLMLILSSDPCCSWCSDSTLSACKADTMRSQDNDSSVLLLSEKMSVWTPAFTLTSVPDCQQITDMDGAGQTSLFAHVLTARSAAERQKVTHPSWANIRLQLARKLTLREKGHTQRKKGRKRGFWRQTQYSLQVNYYQTPGCADLNEEIHSCESKARMLAITTIPQ